MGIGPVETVGGITAYGGGSGHSVWNGSVDREEKIFGN